jgi:hypothetical protein
MFKNTIILLLLYTVLAFDFSQFFQGQEGAQGEEGSEHLEERCESQSGNYLCPVTR